MSLADCRRSHEQSPPSIQHMQDQIRSTCEDIIHFCSQETEATFYQAEQSLQVKISSLACLLLQLFLMSFQEQFDYSIWLELYFPLNLSGWTTWKVGFKLTSTTFVRLSTLRGALESLRNGEQHLDFTCYAWTTHHFRYLF